MGRLGLIGALLSAELGPFREQALPYTMNEDRCLLVRCRD
jgi:hypothetical protein